ncbi:DUF1364 domain-containing protein [Aggregatibacter actinomycetemcomitans]|uniref:DUF1364 domain-containing protein n=1 Tax=Aggregatibacter actinomycetemcomitans TaxID=714 RepID=UPI0011D9EECF|nr:DUF1364 domain-containing protein [Aggregatibacter actinomycetemcomitans]TYA25076.1 DUF1364 domain-containing protein [Aggregatibacter actinomycetemcomitans]
MVKVDYRKEAKGRDCQVRLIGVCNHNPETTVLAHIRAAGITGAGQKAPDKLGAWACYNCHMAIDGQIKTNYTRDELQLAHLEGVMLTQAILISEGKL